MLRLTLESLACFDLKKLCKKLVVLCATSDNVPVQHEAVHDVGDKSSVCVHFGYYVSTSFVVLLVTALCNSNRSFHSPKEALLLWPVTAEFSPCLEILAFFHFRIVHQCRQILFGGV